MQSNAQPATAPGRLQHLLGTADWLDAPRIRRWATSCLAVQLICGLILAAGTHGLLMRLPKASTTDFVSFYAAGTVAAEPDPARVYDRATHYAAEKAATDPGISYVYFFYPPVYLLYCRLLALLPYLPAFLGFELLGVGACALALRRILRPAPAWWALPLLSFSPALWAFGFGQNAFMTAAMFGAGTWLLDRRRSLAAGLVLGLLFYKPHTGLLLPVALLAAADWRAIAGATITVAAAIALSAALFGWTIWVRFVEVILHSPGEFAAGAITPFATTINVLGTLRDHGAGTGLAWAMQGFTQLAVVAAIVWCWRTRSAASPGARYAALISGALLAMPIVLFYDLTALAIAGAWIVRDARRTGFLRGEKVTLAATWLCGLLCYPLARIWHLPLGLIAVACIFAISLRRHASAPDAAYHVVNPCTPMIRAASCVLGRMEQGTATK